MRTIRSRTNPDDPRMHYDLAWKDICLGFYLAKQAYIDAYPHTLSITLGHPASWGEHNIQKGSNYCLFACMDAFQLNNKAKLNLQTQEVLARRASEQGLLGKGGVFNKDVTQVLDEAGINHTPLGSIDVLDFTNLFWQVGVGNPVLVNTKWGGTSHFRLIVGMNIHRNRPTTVCLVDPLRRNPIWMPANNFLNQTNGIVEFGQPRKPAHFWALHQSKQAKQIRVYRSRST